MLAYLLIDLDKKSEARQMGEVLIGEMRWSCIFSHLTCKTMDHIISVSISLLLRDYGKIVGHVPLKESFLASHFSFAHPNI